MNKTVTGQVSILVASYNHGNYIEQCLNSIRDDSYNNKQLIIIDDGSKDNSVEIIEKWIQNNEKFFLYPIIFKSRENRGLTKTLKEMLELASGEYILPLASDDYIIDNSIGKRVEVFKNNPSVMALFADCVVVDSNNNILHDSGIIGLYGGNKRILSHTKFLPLYLILHWCIPGPVIMYRRQVINKISLYDENNPVEDRYLYLNLLSQNLLAFTDLKVAAYRIHGSNSIKISAQKVHEGVLLAQKKMLNNFNGILNKALKCRIYLDEYSFDNANFFEKTKNKIIRKVVRLSIKLMDYYCRLF